MKNLSSTPAWQPYPPENSKQKHTVTGDVRVLRNVAAFGLKPRDIYVWLPPGYARSQQRYSVMYLLDGQNVFDDAISYVGEWGADETATALARRGLKCILVGIPNAGEERMSEYSPYSRDSKRWGKLVGRGDVFLDFVMQTIKPMVNTSFRTQPGAAHTAICGSSLGGLISLYASLTRPNAFGFCAALSPSVWFSFGKLFDLAQKTHPRKQKIYMDMGLQEGGHEAGGMVHDAREMHRLLLDHKFEVAYIEDANGTHNEACWRKRFPLALRWFLDAQAKPKTI